MTVWDANEFVLGGVRFPIRGAVRQRLVNPFPPKVSTGAPDRDSEILLSSIGAETWRGGLLIERLLQNAPTDRLWESTLDSRWERELRLPPEVTTIGPTQTPPSAAHIVMAGGTLPYNSTDPDTTPASIAVHLWYDTVGAQDMKVTSWSDAGGVFTTILTIPRTGTLPVGGAVNIQSGGTFWLCFPIPSGAGATGGVVYLSRSGTIFTANFVSQVLSNAIAASHLVVWDGRLWAYDYRTGSFAVNNTTVADASNRVSGCWTQKATLTERPFEVKRLLVLYNADGTPLIHAVTKSGLIGYDPVADKWVPTQLQWPRKQSAGAACTWRGDAYIGVGQSLYEYDGRNARNLGLDRDFGLPAVVRGDIAQVADAFSWLAVGTTADDPTSPAHNAQVLLWDAQGWHCLSRSVSTNIPFYWLQYLQADTPRLWWSDGAGTHYCDLPSQVYNPKFITTTRYAPSGFGSLPRWDAGWPEKTKTWSEVHVRTKGCGPGQVCSINYQLDDDDTLPGLVPLLAQMQDDGEGGAHVFPLGTTAANDGIISHNIRFNAFMSTTDPTKTPVLESLVVYYILNSPKRYAYSFQVDCTEDYANQDLFQLVTAGQMAVDNDLFLPASFRRDGRELGNLATKPVTVTQFDNTGFTGMDERGYYNVTVVEV